MLTCSVYLIAIATANQMQKRFYELDIPALENVSHGTLIPLESRLMVCIDSNTVRLAHMRHRMYN